MAAYESSSSDSEFHGENAEDLSYAELDTLPECLLSRAHELRALQLDHNNISVLPPTVSIFNRLIVLDISNNNVSHISDEIVKLKQLRTFTARNNRLDEQSLPKDFGLLKSLEVVNFSGNLFETLPPQLAELRRLKCLYLGGNRIQELPHTIRNLTRLQVLYLGGNQLADIPAEIGYMHSLTALVLCDNQLQSLPPTMIHLQRLQSLTLHNNQLSTLPTEIVSLNLVELSLRNNPLVKRFVQDLVYNPPTLLELSGRCVKIEKVNYTRLDLPENLIRYLDSAQRCVNPKCKGVYFTSRVEHIKFVDFCGKYRLPLLQYLCSPSCTTLKPTVCGTSSDSDSDVDDARHRMRRVLLG
ncbi:leucine-rich repeat-containing protein 58-like [Haliotis cracherodii]|uniref:leucine-rich repeat-containing protein 58-like n=1 Tax=Haliotis cracherodii TaxID=6455 RepID=UPI0039E78194